MSGSAARSHTSADSPPPASRSTRVSSKAPQGAQARPRRANASHASSTWSGAAARTKPKLGKASSQRSSATLSRPRQALDVEGGAAAGQLEQLQQRPGHAGHRHVAGRVAEPALGDLDERLAVLAQRRRLALAQRAPDRRVVAAIAALQAEGGEEHVTGPRGGCAQRRGHAAGAEGRQRRRGAERQVAADDRHTEPLGRPCQPVEHLSCVVAVGADERVDERERPPAHGPHVGHVGGDRRGAGRERVGGEQRGRDGLAADDEAAVAVGDERGIVAVAREAVALEQRQVALGPEAGGGADGGGEMSEVGHDASASVLQRVRAVNVGLGSFADAVRVQGAEVVDVDWRPPGGGDADVVALLERAWGACGERIEQGNAAALRAIEGARPHVVTVAPAGEAIDGLEDGMLLHAGPPIEWERVCDPQRRALVAACLLEGWAADRDDAAARLAAGEIRLRCGNEVGHVGPMTGVCSPSMAVWVVRDEGSGVRAFSTLNEGPGRTLWFGVGDDEAVERARFLRDRAGPLLARLLERTGPIDVLDLAAQGLQMGDELHMRSQATTNLLWRRLLPAFAAEGGEDVGSALTANHLFFLNLVMAAAKCASLAAAGSSGSTLVTLMARNGTDMAVQLAGLPGQWFTAPAAPVQDALLREGFAAEDAALDIGDSAVLECIGLGGMAVAAAPAVAAFFGGGAADAAARSRLMGEICAGRSARFTLPALDHAGSPVGIDARLVVELGVAPQITTGVLHATQGAGQIGAGIAHQPLEPFRDALAALIAGLA